MPGERSSGESRNMAGACRGNPERKVRLAPHGGREGENERGKEKVKPQEVSWGCLISGACKACGERECWAEKNPGNHEASSVFRTFGGILPANFWSGQRSYYCPCQHADLWIPGNVRST
jgi:hypothetical protein